MTTEKKSHCKIERFDLASTRYWHYEIAKGSYAEKRTVNITLMVLNHYYHITSEVMAKGFQGISFGNK